MVNDCENFGCIFRESDGGPCTCDIAYCDKYIPPKSEESRKMNRIKETIDRQKRRNPGNYERYNYDILNYLRDKFPEESESAIQEAAAFISNRTAIVVQDINQELSRKWEKAFYDSHRKIR